MDTSKEDNEFSFFANREPFGGKCYGIWDVEGDSEPVVIFTKRDKADRELERRRALPEGDEDRLDVYHHVFPCDVMGAWWNSHDPDPREDMPLTNAEILSVQDGDV